MSLRQRSRRKGWVSRPNRPFALAGRASALNSPSSRKPTYFDPFLATMPVFSSRPLESGPSDAELAASGVPDTSPTWELELLISGAVFFVLFQLPSLLNGFFARIEPHATIAVMPAILVLQIYVKAIVY